MIRKHHLGFWGDIVGEVIVERRSELLASDHSRHRTGRENRHEAP
jgi:hypothetical protein